MCQKKITLTQCCSGATFQNDYSTKAISDLVYNIVLLLSTFASGGSPIFPLVVHQPASPSIYCGAYVGAVEKMMCVVCVSITEGT